MGSATGAPDAPGALPTRPGPRRAPRAVMGEADPARKAEGGAPGDARVRLAAEHRLGRAAQEARGVEGMDRRVRRRHVVHRLAEAPETRREEERAAQRGRLAQDALLERRPDPAPPRPHPHRDRPARAAGAAPRPGLPSTARAGTCVSSSAPGRLRDRGAEPGRPLAPPGRHRRPSEDCALRVPICVALPAIAGSYNRTAGQLGHAVAEVRLGQGCARARPSIGRRSAPPPAPRAARGAGRRAGRRGWAARRVSSDARRRCPPADGVASASSSTRPRAGTRAARDPPWASLSSKGLASALRRAPCIEGLPSRSDAATRPPRRLRRSIGPPFRVAPAEAVQSAAAASMAVATGTIGRGGAAGFTQALGTTPRPATDHPWPSCWRRAAATSSAPSRRPCSGSSWRRRAWSARGAPWALGRAQHLARGLPRPDARDPAGAADPPGSQAAHGVPLPGRPRAPQAGGEGALGRHPRRARMAGVPTRKRDGLVRAMGMSGISKSSVPRLCRETRERAGASLARPIECRWPCLWLDATPLRWGGCPTALIAEALTVPPARTGRGGHPSRCAAQLAPSLLQEHARLSLKVREGGRIVSVAATAAVAANTDGAARSWVSTSARRRPRRLSEGHPEGPREARPEGRQARRPGGPRGV